MLGPNIGGNTATGNDLLEPNYGFTISQMTGEARTNWIDIGGGLELDTFTGNTRPGGTKGGLLEPPTVDPPIDPPTTDDPDPGFPLINPLSIRLGDGTVKTFSNINEGLNAAIAQSGRAILPDGTESSFLPFMGGYLIKTGQGWVPIQVAQGGDYLPGQMEALQRAGLLIDKVKPPVGIVPQIPPPTIDDDAKPNAILTQLLNAVLQQGQVGGQNFDKIREDLGAFTNTLLTQADIRGGKQMDIVNALLGMNIPALNDILEQRNTGLSADARAAMTTRAIEDPARIEEEGRRRITQELLQSGAMGGSMPGSPEAITREFGGLISESERLRSEGLQNVALEDQNQLNVNRTNAINAANSTTNLLGASTGALSPGEFLNPAGQAFGTSLGAVTNQQRGILDSFGIGSDIGRTLADNQPESLRNILLSGLLSNIPGLLNLIPGGGGNNNDTNGDDGGGTNRWDLLRDMWKAATGGLESGKNENDFVIWVKNLGGQYPGQSVGGLNFDIFGNPEFDLRDVFGGHGPDDLLRNPYYRG